MGMFDNLKKTVTKAVDQHGDEIAKGLDQAGELADKQTKGKHSGQISGGVTKAKDALDGLDGRDDDIPDKPASRP